MSEIKITEAVAKMVEILAPLSSEDRLRAVKATMTLLGEEPAKIASGPYTKEQITEDASSFPTRVRVWMSQNGISADELEQVFHIGEGTAEVIASEIPGKNDKEKTYGAYILTGLATFVATGDSSFTDKAARELCRSAGCLNTANHALYIREKGNEFAGTKDKGWTLTAPGLKRGAVLIKELSKVGQ